MNRRYSHILLQGFLSFAIVLFQVCKGKKTRLSFTLGMGAAAALSLLPFFFDDEIKYVYKGLIATAIILSAFLINFGIPLIFYKMQSIKS